MWLHFLLSPLTLGLLIASLLALGWRSLPHAFRYLGLSIELILLATMAPLGANALVWTVESRLAVVPPCIPPAPDTIVVLSGGMDRIPRSVTDYSALNLASLRRLFAGVALWKRTTDARLVFAGGGVGVPESVLLAGLATRLGVPSVAIRTEQTSLTTWENAQNLARVVPSVPSRIWLVSSALHLPRALVAFRAAGFDPCPWPSESLYLAPGGIGYLVPQSSSLVKSEQAIHELLGGVVYALWSRETRSSSRELPIRQRAP